MSWGTGEPPEDVTGALATIVAGVMPVIAERIPVEPAARLGRLGMAGGPIPATVDQALRLLGPMLPERLLGALELTVGGLRLEVPDGLGLWSPDQPAAVQGEYPVRTAGRATAGTPVRSTVAVVRRFGDGEVVSALSTLDQLRPGTTGLVHRLAAVLADHPTIRPMIAVDGTDEPQIAARHGAAYLALTVGTAAAVFRVRAVPGLLSQTPAIVGTALGAALILLAEAPMPPSYQDALLARRRAEYRLPVLAGGTVRVREHRFALVEDVVPEQVDFSGTGLVGVVPGGVVIRTGTADGEVHVMLEMAVAPPDTVEVVGWDEVVEVSWTATTGSASVPGMRAPGQDISRGHTPPWPGEYRIRVHATGRDDGRSESYRLIVWSAPAAPEIMHKRTDRLGRRLRGEPETPTPVRPEDTYRWIRDTAIGQAATVTVVTGSTPEQVLRAFGADPSGPATLSTLDPSFDIDPWVAVLTTADGAVLTLEANGWQGAQRPVLRGLSASGRAASMYWNVEALSRVSFAELGEVLASFEPGQQVAPEEPLVTAALDGLDFADYRGKVEKGLVAVERFTGHPIREADLARIMATDVAYPILPLLDELYPEARLPDRSRRFPGSGPLGPDTDALAFLPDERLRELAWRTAGEVVTHFALDDHPAVRATLSARALSPEAETLARTAQLTGRGEHHWLWQTLYAATNPDPLAAAIGALNAARYAMAGAAASLLDRVREELR